MLKNYDLSISEKVDICRKFDTFLDGYYHSSYYWKSAYVPPNSIFQNSEFTTMCLMAKCSKLATKIGQELNIDGQNVYQYLLNPDFQVEQYIPTENHNSPRIIDDLLVAEEQSKLIVEPEKLLKIKRKIIKKGQYTPITCVKKIKLSPNYFYYKEQQFLFLSETFLAELEDYDEEFNFLSVPEQTEIMLDLISDRDTYTNPEKAYAANSEKEYRESFEKRHDGADFEYNPWYTTRPVLIDNRPLENDQPKKLVIQRKYSK